MYASEVEHALPDSLGLLPAVGGGAASHGHEPAVRHFSLFGGGAAAAEPPQRSRAESASAVGGGAAGHLELQVSEPAPPLPSRSSVSGNSAAFPPLPEPRGSFGDSNQPPIAMRDLIVTVPPDASSSGGGGGVQPLEAGSSQVARHEDGAASPSLSLRRDGGSSSLFGGGGRHDGSPGGGSSTAASELQGRGSSNPDEDVDFLDTPVHQERTGAMGPPPSSSASFPASATPLQSQAGLAAEPAVTAKGAQVPGHNDGAADAPSAGGGVHEFEHGLGGGEHVPPVADLEIFDATSAQEPERSLSPSNEGADLHAPLHEVRRSAESEDGSTARRARSRCCFRPRCPCRRRAATADSAEQGLQEEEPREQEEEDEDVDAQFSRSQTAVAAYSKRVPARFPCICSFCGILAVKAIVAAGILLMPFEVETDFGAFMKTDVNTSIMRDSFLYALSHRSMEGRRLHEERRLQGAALYKNFDVSVAYELTEEASGGNLFDADILAEILRFETGLRNLPKWKELCARAESMDLPFCEPGISFAAYALPSLTVPPGEVVPSSFIFDGKGRDAVPLESTIRILEQEDLVKKVLPSGFDLKARSTSTLRSVFRFKMYCCDSYAPLSVQRSVVGAMKEEWKVFLEETFVPTLQAAAKGEIEGYEPEVEGRPFPLKIYFDGEGIKSYEVLQTLMGDLILAGGAMAFVLFYLCFHTKSVLLSCLGLLMIILSVPLSYVVFAGLTGTRTMHIASFLSLFLIVGLGSDVVFVYTDFWKASAEEKRSYKARLSWTAYHAGKSSLATSATTAVSFFANLASVLKPLREFGFFMGLCVMLVWVLLSAFFLPLCLVDERSCGCCRLRGCRRQPPPDDDEAPGHGTGTVSSGTSGRPPTFVERFVAGLQRWRGTVVITVSLLCFFALVGAGMSVEVDSGVPSIFPDDHNQNRGQEVIGRFPSLMEVFKPLDPAPRTTADVCSEHSFTGAESMHCSLFWCEAKTLQDASSCQCFRKEEQRSSLCSLYDTVTVKQRWVAQYTESHMLSNFAQDVLVNQTGSLPIGFGSTTLAPLLLQEWESGAVRLMPMTEFTATVTRPASGSCGWQDLCFCGGFVCSLPADWQPAAPGPGLAAFEAAVGSQGVQGRALQAQVWRVPFSLRAKVDVVFGIDILAGATLLGEIDMAASWAFQPRHDPGHHWTQRNMHSFCTDLPANLRVTGMTCWINDFRDFVLARGERFPLAFPDLFDSMIMDFVSNGLVMSSTGFTSAKDFLWIRDDGVKASFMTFDTDVSKYAGTEAALTAMGYWDAYLNDWNLQAQTTARGAWHTAQLWVRAQAYAELISSTAMTLVIVILLAFLGMLGFTRDSVLSLLVVLATIGVIAGLAFFIMVIMGWAIGPIEVIALIVFIGYAVTYSLHIAHMYGSHEAIRESESGSEPQRIRSLRTTSALKSIGGAALGSAATTVGCSIFLLFCTLVIFKKLGAVVLAVTIMSILMALLPLPAMLLMCGPLHPGRRCCPTPQDFVRCGEEMTAGVDKAKTRMAEHQATWAAAAAARAATKQSESQGQAEEAPIAAGAASGAAVAAASHGGQLPPPPGANAAAEAARPAVPPPAPPPQTAPPPATQRDGGAAVGAAAVAATAGAVQAAQRPPPGSGGGGGGGGGGRWAPDVAERHRRLQEMELDIGTESPLERIWSREAASNGKVRAMDLGRPHQRS